MFDILLHVGLEHPNLLWVAVPSLLAFALGLGIGLLARRESDTPETATDGTPEPTAGEK